jgi:hypothetical protein
VSTGFKGWHAMLLLTIASFVGMVISLSLMVQEMQFDTILGFFDIFAAVGVYGTWAAGFLIAGIVFLVLTIILGAMKR